MARSISEANCLNCSRYLKCDYTNKRAAYRCDNWKAQKHRSFDDLFSETEALETTPSGLILPAKNKGLEYDERALNKAFDLMEEALESALNNDLPIPKDLKLNDDAFPLAANFFEFCVDEQWGFKDIVPFGRQFWMGLKLFGEICPDCTKKKNGRRLTKDLRDIPVKANVDWIREHLVLLRFGICPKCKKTKKQLVKEKSLNMYSELAVAAGQRAGKSIFTSFLATYITHRYLKLQKPVELMTGVANAQLTFSFVSIDKGGAMRNLWNPFGEALADSRWFEAYNAWLKAEGARLGEELFKNMDTFIHYRHRKMYLHPTVPNQRALRGATRFGYVLDELGWFDANNPDKVTLSADGIYKALNNSLLTARNAASSHLKAGYYNIPSAYALNVSSPSSTDDKIMQLVTRHRHSRTILALHAPTWEINPKIPRNDPELMTAYADDPIAAERDYGANPPMNAAPFISDESIVEKAFGKVKNRVTYEFTHRKSSKENGKMYRAAEVKCYPTSTVHGSVLAIDAGYSDNSFAIAVGHREDKQIVFDVLVEIMPVKGQNVLHHARIVNSVVYELIKAFNVKYLIADRWNSLFLLHKAMEDFPGLIAEQYSVKYDDFLLYRSYLEGGRITFPMLETKSKQLYRDGIGEEGKTYPTMFEYMPAAHLYHQCLTVQDGKRTVEKGSKKTDDLFRAVVLGTTYLLEDEVIKLLTTEKRINTNRGIVALGTASTFSGNVVTNSRGKGIAAI